MSTPFIPFHRPSFGPEELEQLRETLESGWVTTGAKTRQLEQDFATLVGCRHAVAVASCTAAMHLALEAVGVGEGDEVIVPTMTFAATAAVAEHLRARPVLVDCMAETLTIDPLAVKQALTPRTRAVIPVHYAGHPCEMAAVMDLAGAAGLRVIEDAAHAVPARYQGRPIGSIGDLTAYSFYATKNVTTGEGGMLCTDQEAWAERARLMSLHGMSRDGWKRYTADGSWAYEILAPGFKYNFPDLLAAIGLAQLRKLPAFQARRRQIVSRYTAAFADLDALDCPVERPEVEHAWHLYVLRLRLERLRFSRDQFIDELKARGVATSVHFIPLHLHAYYRQKYGYRAQDFPVAYHEYQRIVSLPLYPGLSDTEVQRVIDAVHDVIARFAK